MGNAHFDSSAGVKQSTEHAQLIGYYVNVTSFVAMRRERRHVPHVKMIPKVRKSHDVNTAPVKIDYDVKETLKDT